MDRREFLRRTGQGAALAGAGMAGAQVAKARTPVTPCDLRAPKTGRVLDEGEVIGIGMIGVGGMGTGHLRELLGREKDGRKIQVRAVSDVYERRKKRAQAIAKEIVGRDIDAYTDYLDLIARDDIHAVVIATPDHWHAANSIHALEAGLDVYCQKPVTLTIEESLDVRDKVYETGRVFQCGAQRCSEDWWWQARKLIKEGGIGKVLWAQADYSRNSADGPDERGGEWNWPIDADATDDPAGGDGYVDWARWLGPARKRPFSKPRFFQFRKFWDYSGGIATDLLYHVLAPMTIALDAKAPEKATAAGGIYVQHDDREVPDTYMSMLDYPDDYTVVLTSSMANRQALPTVIRGHRATIRPENDGIKVTAENEFKEWFSKRYGAEEIFIPGEPRAGHVDNWLECIRTRKTPHLDADTAYRAMAGIKMGVDAYRQQKAVFWDCERERYVRKHPRPHRASFLPAEDKQA
ncbi:MAG: Gfo/Idh/MocA family oxidoreductase [Candidatus Hydrogenedentes bacterium]|nr:Gfo/Idh/MocA family oxidoreductase [Candidatus Hydrogenedentota bacterium]